MAKKKAEIVPAGLDALVRQHVSKAMAARIIEPWFRSKAETKAIRARQSVPELRKWSRYFDRWGCLICGQKEFQHVGLGLCVRCHARIVSRLTAIVRELAEERPAARIQQDVDALDRPIRTACALLSGREE
jgi:hypothetical protein